MANGWHPAKFSEIPISDGLGGMQSNFWKLLRSEGIHSLSLGNKGVRYEWAEVTSTNDCLIDVLVFAPTAIHLVSREKKTLQRNEWILLRSVTSITNIFFYDFPDFTMDHDVEMLDDDHLQLLFAQSPPLYEDDEEERPPDAAAADNPQVDEVPAPAAAPPPPAAAADAPIAEVPAAAAAPPPPPAAEPADRGRGRRRSPDSPPGRRDRRRRQADDRHHDRERMPRRRSRSRSRSPVDRRKYIRSSVYFQFRTDQLRSSTVVSFLQGDLTTVVGRAT